MNSNHWESSYRHATAQLEAPASLDEKVLSSARAIKPLRRVNDSTGRMLSKVASGFSAIAIAIVLLHPAQYINATPEQVSPQNNSRELGLERYRSKLGMYHSKSDAWYALRTDVKAGNYTELCAQWRRQQRNAGEKELPSDLAVRARQHCRILP
ncbi:hypothetical protein [Microbulbifer hydrolyticus]|uniref:Uncharacterized protein n=1 Tax=Microbulbifer hydrolyticus TaxID=48074 RepID=A0A6P1TAT8_9GAMM|nr:hypothetical protein [Microbulbifer hydrolyticus]MBB5210787.1 hypothetical protein [Microbulbifer hydrolyticus]QHQ38773.1 hypothetical protein GTQ55_07075 [Microbulbifer hydrolyticus]